MLMLLASYLTYLLRFLGSMAGYKACQVYPYASQRILTQSARVMWSALLLVAMTTAWFLHSFAKPLLEKMPCK